MKLLVKYGSEGPAHDPYAYIERTVITTDGCRYTLHDGLATFIKAGDVVISDSEATSHNIFTTLTGLTPKQFDKAKERIDRTCKNCGNRKHFYSADGFPGESLTICARCQAIVACDFDISAVE